MLRPQTNELPQATPDALTRPFWDGCARSELLFQRCGRCSAASFPPLEHCRDCLAREQKWEASSGRGTLYSWSVVHRPATPAFQTPYAVAIVTLEEGYQMVTNIVHATAGELRLDLPVRVSFHQAGDLWLPYFTPA